MFDFSKTTLTRLEIDALLRDHFDGLNDATEKRITSLFTEICARNGDRDVIKSLEDAREYFDAVKSMSFTRSHGKELVGHILLNDAYIVHNSNGEARAVHLQVFTAAINENSDGAFELHFNYQKIDEAFWCYLKDEHRE